MLSAAAGWHDHDLVRVAGRRSGNVKRWRSAAGKLVGVEIDELIVLPAGARGRERERSEPVDGLKGKRTSDIEINCANFAGGGRAIGEAAMKLEAKQSALVDYE